MASKDELLPHERLLNLRDRVLDYFKECIAVTGRRSGSTLEDSDYWNVLPAPLKKRSNALDNEIVGLAHLIGPIIRRSPLLTEADDREAGHTIKGMRSALRLRRFRYWDTSVLHDEGLVLGVQKAGEDDDTLVHPEHAPTL